MIALLKDLKEEQRVGLRALLESIVRQNDLLLLNEGLSEIHENNLQKLRTEYFEAISQKYEFMDMGGISPRVAGKAGSRIVSVPMEDVFIPLQAREDEGAASSSFRSVKEPIFVNIENKLSGIGAILANPKVVVLGHPGAGKTTIGKYIAFVIAQGKTQLIGESLGKYIPVIAKASAFGKLLNKQGDLSFYRYLTGDTFTDKYGPLFGWALKNDQCLVIIDGLDEVPDIVLRKSVAEKIEEFVSDFSKNRFLVTSRIVGYKGNQLTSNFVHFTLTELEKDQIVRFLENWYMAVIGKQTRTSKVEARTKARNLWEAIEETEGVKKLAGTPLLLTIIALVSYYGSKLPDRRVELYQLATETLLSNWPLKQREQIIDYREILPLLEPIAYQIFISSDDRLITEYEFRPLFEEQIRKSQGVSLRKAKAISNQLLNKIAEHTGFFLSRGTNEHGQEVYGFLHPTFAEYLTARHLSEQWLDFRLTVSNNWEFVDHLHDPSWHEVILLMAGHLGTMSDHLATQFVETIESLQWSYDKYLYRHLLLIAEIIGDNVPVSREKRDNILSRLISIGLDTPCMPMWESIVEKLGSIASAFPIVQQPKQLIIQENDSVLQRVRKTVISRNIGITKKPQWDILFRSLFAEEETSQIAENEISSFFASLWQKYFKNSSHLFIFATPHSESYFPIPREIAVEIQKNHSPIFDLKTLNEIDKNYTEGEYQIWLFDLYEISQLGILDIISLIASSENGNIRKTIDKLLVAISYSEHITKHIKFIDNLKEIFFIETIESQRLILNVLVTAQVRRGLAKSPENQ